MSFLAHSNLLDRLKVHFFISFLWRLIWEGFVFLLLIYLYLVIAAVSVQVTSSKDTFAFCTHVLLFFYIYCLMDEKVLTYVTFYHIICFIFSWLIKEFYTIISNSGYIRGPPLPTELYESILCNYYNHSLSLCGTKQGSEFLPMGFEVLFFKIF